MSVSTILRYTSSPTGANVLLEKENWRGDGGRLTAGKLFARIFAARLGVPVSPVFATKNCAAQSGGRYQATIYAYPTPAPLDFEAGVAAPAEIQAVTEDIGVIQLRVNFKGSATASIPYPALRVLECRWLGECWSADGGPVGKPGLHPQGNELRADFAVYGTAFVVVESFRYIYRIGLLTQTVFWAVWSDGHSYVELEPPDEADDEDSECDSPGFGGGGDTGDGDDDEPRVPVSTFGDSTLKLDYCKEFGGGYADAEERPEPDIRGGVLEWR
jgi:hypothetical protein